MSRQDQWRTFVTVNAPGLGDLGVWDNFEGGEVDSDSLTYGPGGMAPKISLGGTKTVGEITVGRLYMLGRDSSIIKSLFEAVGRAAVTIKRVSMDKDGNEFHPTSDGAMTYTGVLKTVTPPPANSDEGGGNPSMIELVVTPDSTIA